MAVANAKIVFARSFRSAFLPDSNSNDITEEHVPAQGLPFHRDPIVLINQAGRNARSNGETTDSDYLDGLSSPPFDTTNKSPEISAKQSGYRSSTWTKISSNSDPEAQAKKAKQLQIEQYTQAEYEKCVVKPITAYPRGIGRVAALQTSSDHLSIHRKFKYIRNRILLGLEIELTANEKALYNLEAKCEKDPNNMHLLTGISHRDGEEKRHKQLLRELTEQIKEYDSIALSSAQMNALKQPEERDHLSLFNYVVSRNNLADPCKDYIYEKDDHFCLIDTSNNFFEGQMQAVLSKSPPAWFKKLVQTEGEVKLSTDKAMTYYSSSRILIVARVLSVCLAVVILLAPVYLLFLLPMSRGGMTITTTAFLVVFAGLMSFITGAKLEIVFIGTATYGALLITFLGNMSEGKNAFVPS